jgi:thiopurine S-methyltransferase
MEPDFWHKKWESNVIGFHKEEPNPLLVSNIEALVLSKGSRVFVPLCGKTLDIAWLLSQGHRVVGIELSVIAVNQLFESLQLEPTIIQKGKLTHYSADSIDIYVGNIFDLTKTDLGIVDAIYDRAAFVALPLEMRMRYSQHLIAITNSAPQLLVTFEYDQAVMNGPPFATTNLEINQHYQNVYDLTLLTTEVVEGGLKGQFEAVENVWLLKKSLNKRVFDDKVILPPQHGRWKKMLPILLLLGIVALLAYYFNWDAKVTAGGAVLVGFYTGLVTWLLGMITLIPIIGPILVKILTMSFIWLLNAVGYAVAYVAIKRGYSKDVLTYRGLTIALIVGLVIGYVLGSI